jgi:hypothetical protein
VVFINVIDLFRPLHSVLYYFLNFSIFIIRTTETVLALSEEGYLNCLNKASYLKLAELCHKLSGLC